MDQDEEPPAPEALVSLSEAACKALALETTLAGPISAAQRLTQQFADGLAPLNRFKSTTAELTALAEKLKPSVGNLGRLDLARELTDSRNDDLMQSFEAINQAQAERDARKYAAESAAIETAALLDAQVELAKVMNQRLETIAAQEAQSAHDEEERWRPYWQLTRRIYWFTLIAVILSAASLVLAVLN